MRLFSEDELREAARAIASTRMKSEKAILKLKEGSPQHRLIARGIAAYSLALSLIARELGESQPDVATSREALARAQQAFTFSSMIARVEKAILPKVCRGHAAAYARHKADFARLKSRGG